MARDSASSGPGRTRKGFPPAGTEIEAPTAQSTHELDDKTNLVPARTGSGQISDSSGDFVPFVKVSESDERTGLVLDKRRDRPAVANAIPAKDKRHVANRDFVDLPEGSLVGEYEIERQIGQGGMGAVYSAVHPILGKRVAIKIIGDEMSRDADAIARFRREARAVAQLASPHIVGVFGFGEIADGRAYFVMEHLSGESLRDRLARGRVPLDEALELLDQVARGLEVAHEAGIVHRDLKPENIFIERRRNAAPIVKLLDFGIVKLAKHDDNVTKTQAGVLIGTPVYVAPEQIRAAGSVDHRADIYSLGGVAFEMILGRVPFERVTVVELIVAHLECAPPQPRSLWPEIPAALDALLFAMLAKDPAKRPTLGYLQETIEKLRRSAFTGPTLARSLNAPMNAPGAPPFHAHKTAAPRPSSPKRDRMRRLALMVGALAALVVMIAIARTTGTTESTPDSTSRSTVIAGDASAVVVTAPLTSRPEVTITPIPITTPGVTSAPAPSPRLQVVVPHPVTATPVKSTPALAPTSAPVAPSIPPAPTKGELAINSKPPCEITIDKKPTGRHTPLTGLMLEPGFHSVTLINERYRIEDAMTVQILPGTRTPIIKDYSARVNHIDPNGTIDPFKSTHP